jgi:hypothetical protein
MEFNVYTYQAHSNWIYKILVVKMFEDQTAINATTKLNYEALCDYDIISWLTCVLPMLEVVQSLSKLAQGSSIHLFAT